MLHYIDATMSMSKCFTDLENCLKPKRHSCGILRSFMVEIGIDNAFIKVMKKIPQLPVLDDVEQWLENGQKVSCVGEKDAPKSYR